MENQNWLKYNNYSTHGKREKLSISGKEKKNVVYFNFCFKIYIQKQNNIAW